jgi:uncharacterized alpha-E superfamily protein
MTALLARWAECVFWLARYVERVENLARILEVQETFARDSRGRHDWGVVLAINADTGRFLARGTAPSAESVLRFYVIDRDNPTSIVSALHAARENARALRPLISTEMWVQLNVFHNRIAALGPADVVEERVARLCAVIKEGCDTHAGITAGTFYRDEAACFYQLGAAIECADQTTRLLDAKLLGMPQRSDADPGAAADAAYWTALLRSVAGYQAFRRRHPRGMVAEQVAAFLISDPCFPRSVACNIGIVAEQLERLRRHYGLRRAAAALERVEAIADTLEVRKVRALMGIGGMHRFNDHLQASLIDLTRLLGQSFFGHPRSGALGA